EGRAAGVHYHCVAFSAGLDLDLRALAQLPDDVIERVRRRGRLTFSLNLSRNLLDDLEIHVGRAQRQPPSCSAQQYIRKYWDCGAPFHHALHVAQRLEKSRPFDDELHGCYIEVTDLHRTHPEPGPG